MLHKLFRSKKLSAFGERPRQNVSRRRPRTLYQKIERAADRMVFNWKARSMLYEHLEVNLENGVPAEEALDKYVSLLRKRKKLSKQKIVKSIVQSMRNGSSLAESLAPWAPADEVGAIEAGEIAGKLPTALPSLVEAKRSIENTLNLIKKAFTDPCIYILSVYAAVWFIGKFATPAITQLLPESQARGAAAALYWMGRMSSNWTSLVPPMGLALFVALVIWSFPRWTGKYRVKAEEYFPYSFYRDIQGHMWVNSFVAMYEAGIADVEIFKSQCRYANPWLVERLSALGSRMRNGAELTEALMARGTNGMPPFEFPNPDIIDQISSIAGFNGFPGRLKKIATRWSRTLEEDVQKRIKRYAFISELSIFMLLGYIAYAINEISMQIGTATTGFN